MIHLGPFQGFKGVECGDEIYQYSTEQLLKAKTQANVEQVVIVGCGGWYYKVGYYSDHSGILSAMLELIKFHFLC